MKVAVDETATTAMRYQAHMSRYYQQPRQKHSSGSAEWHGRDRRLRIIQRAIAKSSNVQDLAVRMQKVMRAKKVVWRYLG